MTETYVIQSTNLRDRPTLTPTVSAAVTYLTHILPSCSRSRGETFLSLDLHL